MSLTEQALTNSLQVSYTQVLRFRQSKHSHYSSRLSSSCWQVQARSHRPQCSGASNTNSIQTRQRRAWSTFHPSKHCNSRDPHWIPSMTNKFSTASRKHGKRSPTKTLHCSCNSRSVKKVWARSKITTEDRAVEVLTI